jgi:hypothetical protein
MVFAGRAVQVPLWPLVSFPSPFQLRFRTVGFALLRLKQHSHLCHCRVQYTKSLVPSGRGWWLYNPWLEGVPGLRYVALCCSASEDAPMWYAAGSSL